MPRYEFSPEELAAANPPPSDAIDLFGRTLDVIARVVGLVLLGIGFWMALSVVAEAWALYREPDNGRIEMVAAAIDKGSNLDQILAPRKPAVRRPAATKPEPIAPEGISDDPVAAALEPELAPEPEIEEQAPLPPLRLSYFCAWFVVLALLAILGQLSMLAIRTGGTLVLRDIRRG